MLEKVANITVAALVVLLVITGYVAALMQLNGGM